MAYSKTVWNNNTPPDISAENLNKMEQGIYDAQFPDNGSTGQILSKTNDGTGWVDAPTSAEWGNITGQLSEQTDLYSELESKITLPSGGTTGQVLTKTASGQAWDDVDGLPSGGTAGQVLTKNSSTSGDASWQDVDGLPAGGTAGQVLTKNSSTDGDASWQTSPSGGGGTWGYISGTLTDQTDLVAALDAKANASNLATIESSTTASQAYSTGDYLVLNGQLYEVTADVDSGETLVVGTNISATTVGSELKALNNGLLYESTTTTDSYGTVYKCKKYNNGDIEICDVVDITFRGSSEGPYNGMYRSRETRSFPIMTRIDTAFAQGTNSNVFISSTQFSSTNTIMYVAQSVNSIATNLNITGTSVLIRGRWK